jgi:hypothetical protein
MSSNEFLVLWRIAEDNPPTLQDFTSHRQKGIQLRRVTPDALRLWTGVSVYRSREQAIALARALPHLGSYIVGIRIPLDGSIVYELDNRKHGHCTVWASPEILRDLVVSIEGL